MELAPVPRRRLWSRPLWVLVAVIALAPVTVLALLPTAFGFERYVIAEDASGGALTRGSVVFEQRVPCGDLERADVVTFPVDRGDPELNVLLGEGHGTSSGSTALVTRHIVDLRRGGIVVRVDDEDPGGPTMTVDLANEPTMTRVVFAVPYVGYPLLGGLSHPVWAALCLGFGLLLGWLCLRTQTGRGAVGARVPPSRDVVDRHRRHLAA